MNYLSQKQRELVVLVDEANNPIGQVDKSVVHRKTTLLHRGFSLFIFNNKNELLLQQRSANKKTWPLVWSNSVCGHPYLHEKLQEAAARRAFYELGIKLDKSKIKVILPDYRYRATRDDIEENELCPVMIVRSELDAVPNPEEVNNVKFMRWTDFLDSLITNEYSDWCKEETRLLADNKVFLKWLEEYSIAER